MWEVLGGVSKGEQVGKCWMCVSEGGHVWEVLEVYL